MLRLVPSDAALQLQAWADRSIVEVSGQGGRAAVTARVYPTLGANSSRISVYTKAVVYQQRQRATRRPTCNVTVGAWRANVSREEVLRTAGC